MVAIINTGKSVSAAFHYNENKVKEGKAVCLSAENYPIEVGDLNKQQRLKMLLDRGELNPNVSRKSIHISLNFAPGENLDDQTLLHIARDYMQGIGFADSPYLVYRHMDAGHPHIHIASVKIREDGSRIDTQNIGKLKSEPTRMMIENKYGLVRAEDHKRSLFTAQPVNPTRVLYGQSETRKAISQVLSTILPVFKFTSIPELNALLSLYNIRVERGGEDSRIFKNRGLIYRVLNDRKETVGVPVKASILPGKPTLNKLEKLFLKHDIARQIFKERLKSVIDFILKRSAGSLEKFATEAKKTGIEVLFRYSKEGHIFGLTYIDLNTKCVFNGSSLGKAYAAKAIIERCHAISGKHEKEKEINIPKTLMTSGFTQAAGELPNEDQAHFKPAYQSPNLIEILMQTEINSAYLPFEWRRKRKKKKRK